MFEKFVHPVTGSFIWGIIMLLSLRAVYSCTRKKDYPHLAAFLVIALFSCYMFAQSMGFIPHGFEENLFN